MKPMWTPALQLCEIFLDTVSIWLSSRQGASLGLYVRFQCLTSPINNIVRMEIGISGIQMS